MNSTVEPPNGKAPAQKYAMLPHDVIDAALACGPHAVAVLLALYRRASTAGECYPSLSRIAADAGVSRRHVQTCLDDLAAAGIVTRHRRRSEHGDADATLYVVPTVGRAYHATPRAPDAQGVGHTVRGGRAYGAPEVIPRQLIPKGTTAAARPTRAEVRAYCEERGGKIDPEAWYDHYEAVGWRVGRNPMRDWRAAVRQWERRQREYGPTTSPAAATPLRTPDPVMRDGDVIVRPTMKRRSAP